MSVPAKREQYVLISAMGRDPLKLTNIICRACQDNRCSVVSSRLTRHGQYSLLTVQAGGSWDALARLEGALPSLAKRHTFQIMQTRSEEQNSTTQALPYIVYISALYQPDILAELCQFFVDQNIGLENITYDTYQAPQTGTTMLNATITVSLLADTQINWLRDQFLDFADALYLDALIEPWRPQTP